MSSDTIKVTISKDFEQFIVPLSTEEFEQLETNIVKEGCRDPLVVWSRGGKNMLMDGHNRYKICEKHEIPYQVSVLEFSNFEQAKVWMLNNQLGRRNLTPDQMSYYRGLKYESLKSQRGGYKNVASKGQKDLSTAERLSLEFKVSEKTIKRDAKFARGLEFIGRSNPELKQKILSGDVDVKKSDVQVLADHKDPDKLRIKNAADLYNKAKIIKDRALDEIEGKVREIERTRINNAHEKLAENEPMFLEREDRINKLKGQIISAINRAIRDRDVDAIDELKKLIGKLADEILD